MHEENDIPSPEKIREILDVVSDKVPSLLKELSSVLYSPEQAKQFGLAGATFYKELKAAGMTDDQAFELTNQYMSTMNIGHTMKGFAHHHSSCGPNEHDSHGWEKMKEIRKRKNTEQN
jgi:hypothetical protein